MDFALIFILEILRILVEAVVHALKSYTNCTKVNVTFI